MIAIKNAKIFTMEEATGVLERGTVVVEGDTIRRVSAEQEIPEGARIIDGKGHMLFPGFIEPHCHMGITEEKKEEKAMTAMNVWIR